MPKRDTSWGSQAGWYDRLLGAEGSYQETVILPNLLRLMDLKPGSTVLDLACGPGFFSREFSRLGARVVGVDISPELIAVAREKSPRGIVFKVAPSHDLGFLDSATFDRISIVLAIQNIEDVHGTFKECGRLLKPSGSLSIIMTHPAFRVPGESSWQRDDKERIQYRRVDRYMSESRVKVFMHPGDAPSEYTLSFHRPFQFYFKSLSKSGLCVTRLEEWISDRSSGPGPWAAAENRARREIPLFLYVEARPWPGG